MSASPYYQTPEPVTATLTPLGDVPTAPWPAYDAPTSPAAITATSPTPWPMPTAPTQPTPTQPWSPPPVPVSPPKPKLSSPFSWLVVLVGLGAIALSFVPSYYQITVTVSYFNPPITSSDSVNAWYGIYGWLAAVLLGVAVLPAIIHLAIHRPPLPTVGFLFTMAGLASVIVARLVFPPVAHLDLVGDASWLTIQKSYGWAYWASLACAVIAVGGAAMTMIDARQRAAEEIANPAPVFTPPPVPTPAMPAYVPDFAAPPTVQPPPVYAPPPQPLAPVAPDYANVAPPVYSNPWITG